jgi:hypothetical protein
MFSKLIGNLGLEDFCLQGYNAVKSVENQPTFGWSMSPPILGSKNSQARTQSATGSK